MSFKIIRFYADERPSRTIQKGLTLEQAQAHCTDPETSSRTHSKGRNGVTCEWFDGWTDQV